MPQTNMGCLSMTDPCRVERTNRCIIGDCRAVLRDLITQGVKVQICVTSPPYFGLRNYGHPAQIGFEETPELFVSALVGVFRLVRDLLADDGTLWLNIGDSYNAAGRTGHGTRIGYKQNTNRASNTGADNLRPSVDSLKPKDLIGIPWMLAFALRADGWYLRSEIIWHKVAPMPESVTDRPTRAHEAVFLLSKSEKYFYSAAEARDALKPTSVARLMQPNYDEQEGSDRANGGAKTNGKMKAVAAHFGGRIKSQTNDQTRLASGNEWHQDPTNGANWRDVWPMAADGYTGAHFAVMPRELARRCIVAGSRPGDTVLDPFFGSGTVGEVAQNLGRQWLGIELSPAYAKLQERRTAQQGLVL